jgi:hypothetical protein
LSPADGSIRPRPLDKQEASLAHSGVERPIVDNGHLHRLVTVTRAAVHRRRCGRAGPSDRGWSTADGGASSQPPRLSGFLSPRSLPRNIARAP